MRELKARNQNQDSKSQAQPSQAEEGQQQDPTLSHAGSSASKKSEISAAPHRSNSKVSADIEVTDSLSNLEDRSIRPVSGYQSTMSQASESEVPQISKIFGISKQDKLYKKYM